MLTEEDYESAASRLGVEVAAVKAVSEVESGPYGGFLSTGEPTILFERHLFHRLTNGAHDREHPDISNKLPGGYGKVSEQHGRLQRAVALNRDAALQSASWGRFQVVANNWRDLDYESVQDFVNHMQTDQGQLDSFIRFIEHNGLIGALRNHNWSGFARRYNGPTFAKNHYDTKLAQAYFKHKAPTV